MGFRPDKDVHSIVEAAFSLGLVPALDASALERARELEAVLRDDFPQSERVQQVTLQIKDGAFGNTPGLTTVGMDLRRLGPAGNIEWMLRLHPSFISVNCLTYTKWEEVFPRVLSYLRQAAVRVVSDSVRVAVIGVEFIDRFWHEPAGATAPASELFKSDSRYISRNALGCSKLWHLENGWLDDTPALIDVGGPSDVLNVLNLTTAMQDQKTQTTIRHQVQLRIHQGFADVKAFDGAVGDGSLLERVFVHFHEVNKDVLKDLLQPEVGKQIKLYGEGK